MSIEKIANLIAWAANSFAFSTRYDAADVTDLLKKETFDDQKVKPKRGHSYVAVIDNNPTKDVFDGRGSIARELIKRDWLYVGEGGFGKLEEDEDYTRATIWEVPNRDVRSAHRIVREIAVELGLASNGINC